MTSQEGETPNRQASDRETIRTRQLTIEEGVVAMSGIIARIHGEKCSSCIAMEFTGSTLSLDFGNRIAVCKTARGRTANYVGTCGLFIEGAAWRMLRNREAVMTSDTAMTETNATELSVIIGSSVKSISLASNTLDLHVQFDSGVTLDVFCNCFDNELDNYSLSYLQDFYIVRYRERRQVIDVEEG